MLINQIETVEQDQVIKNSEKLILKLGELKKEMKFDYACCIITDVLKANSKVLVTNQEEELISKAFPQVKQIKVGAYDIGPLMSRKKEIAPAIEKALL